MNSEKWGRYPVSTVEPKLIRVIGHACCHYAACRFDTGTKAKRRTAERNENQRGGWGQPGTPWNRYYNPPPCGGPRKHSR
jgi:hypothetical protein